MVSGSAITAIKNKITITFEVVRLKSSNELKSAFTDGWVEGKCEFKK